MKKINLSSININYLNVLNILIKERNTTRAAEKLGISQAGVSYSLRQLREIFDDDLLVKSKNSRNMVLTQFAQSLSLYVEMAVAKIETVFNFKNFEPKTSERVFRIALTEYTTYIFLKKIYTKLKELAPNIVIETYTLDFDNVQNQLEMNDIDIAIGDFTVVPQNNNIINKYLFDDDYTFFLSENHPALENNRVLSFEEYKKYPSLVLRHPRSDEYREIFTKDKKSLQNLTAHCSCMVYDVISDTDLILLAPKKMSAIFENKGISTIDPDFINYKTKISLSYNKNSDNDMSMQWLIAFLDELAGTV